MCASGGPCRDHPVTTLLRHQQHPEPWWVCRASTCVLLSTCLGCLCILSITAAFVRLGGALGLIRSVAQSYRGFMVYGFWRYATVWPSAGGKCQQRGELARTHRPVPRGPTEPHDRCEDPQRIDTDRPLSLEISARSKNERGLQRERGAASCCKWGAGERTRRSVSGTSCQGRASPRALQAAHRRLARITRFSRL